MPKDKTNKDRLPVFKSVVQCYWTVLSRPWRLVVVAALPLCACLALSFGFMTSSLAAHPAGLLYFLTFLIPMSYMGLSWTRYRLWNRPPRFLLSHPWVAAYGKAVAWYLLWALCFWGLPALLTMIVGGALYGFMTNAIEMFFPLAWLCLSLLGTAVFARLYLALPLIAAGMPASLSGIRRLGRIQGSRFGVAMLLLTTVHIILSGSCAYALNVAMVVLLGRTVMDVAMQDMDLIRAQILYLNFVIALPVSAIIGTALFAELTVIGFRHVTGWESARAALAERFD